MIPDSFIEELKYVSKIEQTIESYVNLKRAGRNLSGLCPFHSEKTPSFTVYPDSQSYYCFGCGSGGDVITFIKQIENLSYVEALKFLAEKNGLTVPETVEDDKSRLRSRVLEINRASAHFFYNELKKETAKNAQDYLTQRGISPKTIKKFGIGFAPDGWSNLRDYLLSQKFTQEEILSAAVATTGRNNSVYDLFRNRIIFPIIDLRGNVIGFGGRLLEGSGPKYINSPDTIAFKKSKNLFALNFAKSSSSDYLILCEGYMDVVAMNQAGFDNAVATLGTSLTEEQSRLISQYCKRVVIAYDSDDAGQNATKRAINMFSKTNVAVDILKLHDAKDPDEYIKKFGSARFAGLLEKGQSAINFEIDKLRKKYNLSISNDKISFLNDFCKLMSDINNPLQRDVHISEVAKEIDVSKDSILLTVNRNLKQDKYSKTKQSSRDLATSVSRNIGTDPKKRKDKLEQIVAEEHLIIMLLKNPDYYKFINTTLSADDFVDDGYKGIYNCIVANIENNIPLDLIHFSDKLSNDLMAKLSQLIVKGQNLKFYPDQAKDFANIVIGGKQLKNKQEISSMTNEEYDKYIDMLRAKK